MSLSKASTMIAHGAFNIGKELTLAQWNYITGKDVNVFSRINIGDNVNWKFIMITRLAFVSTMFFYKENMTLSVDKIRHWMQQWIDDKIFLARMQRRDNVIGSATLHTLYTFMQHSTDVVFMLIDSMIALTSVAVKVAASGVNSLTGYGSSFDIAPLLVSTIENFVSNSYIPSTGPTGAGVLAFVSLVSIATYVENKIIGLLAGALEYVVNRGVPRISEDNIKMIQDVNRINPMLNRDQDFATVYPFAANRENIVLQIPALTNESKVRFLHSFVFGSDLQRAVDDSKKYFESIEMTHGRRRSVSRGRRAPKKKTTTLRKRVQSRSNIAKQKCIGKCKSGQPCKLNAKDGQYCKRHKSQGEGVPQRDEFGKKNNVLKKLSLRF
jgi:hypothetical protein